MGLAQPTFSGLRDFGPGRLACTLRPQFVLPLTLTLGLLVGGCNAPADNETSVEDRTVTLEPPAWGYQIATEPVVIAPWSEEFICSVVRIDPTEDELLVWVNELEVLSSTSSHHMNVFLGDFSFLDAFLGEGAFESQLGVGLGTHSCDDLGNMMELMFPVFPSQRSHQRITMPDGVGIPLIAPLVLVMQHHFLNLTDRPIEINAALNIKRVAPSSVDQVASLIFDDIKDLDVPANGQKVETRTCVLDRDVEFALVSTHTHERGDCATLNRYSSALGEVDPEPFFVNKSWETPPILHFDRDQFVLPAGDGVHWACHFRDRSGDGAVNDGSAAGEMCVFAAVAYPAAPSKEEITQTLQSGDLLAIYALVDELMTDCDQHPEVETPWPMSLEPNLGQPVDSCADWEETESNVLN